jgi:predicted chitinase
MPSVLPQTPRAIAAAAAVEQTDAPPGTETLPEGVDRAPITRGEAEDYEIEDGFDQPDEDVTRSTRGPSRWAADDVSPCYSHLLAPGQTSLNVAKTFELSRRELDLVIAANSYKPVGHNDVIAFGIRGAKLRGAEKYEGVERVPLEDARPNHVNFRCVIGYYNMKTGRISAYTGSTVPWHGYMSKGLRHNMLPTGCYIYKVGTHRPVNKARWVNPALRLSDVKLSESGLVSVLRNKDMVFDFEDDWDQCAPSDNVHCAYSNTGFSSLGCQTVKGGLNDGLWADFAGHLKTLPANARVDYVLFTGAEASIAAALSKTGEPARADFSKTLERLRFGSQGDRVKRLQSKLGLSPTGYLAASSRTSLTEYQEHNDLNSDGVFTPELDAKLGWGVFSDAQPVIQPVPIPSPAATPEAIPPSIGGLAPLPSPAPIPQPAPSPVSIPAPIVQSAPTSAATPVAIPEAIPEPPSAPQPAEAPATTAAPVPVPPVTETAPTSAPTPAVAGSATSDLKPAIGAATLAAISALAEKAKTEAPPSPPTSNEPAAPIPPPAVPVPAAPPTMAAPAAAPGPLPNSAPAATATPPPTSSPAPVPPVSTPPQPAAKPEEAKPQPTKPETEKPVVAKPIETPVAPPVIQTAPGPKPAVELTAETLKEFAPKARPDYVKVLGEQGDDVLTKFGINRSPRRFCHFMAQVGHECGGFTIVEESGAYSAKGIGNIFGPGRHSASVSAAEAQQIAALPVAERGKVLFERVYGPEKSPRKARDLGNTKPGDGYRYRGRGFLQITGRSAYREMGKKIGIDLEADPDRAGDPIGALMTAAAFWDSRKLNTYADQNNIEIITKRINGGHNGLADRKEKYKKALDIWGEDGEGTRDAPTRSPVPGAKRTLEYGDLGPDVLEAKRMLGVLGYDGFILDEDFSKAMHLAVASYQIDRGLTGDGIINAETWLILERDATAAGYAPPSPTRGGPHSDSTAEPLPLPPSPIDQAHFNWGRGRAVWVWALLFLVTAVSYAGLRFLDNPNLLKSQSPSDWGTIAFSGLVGVGSIILMALGHRIARSSKQRAMTRGRRGRPAWDEGLRRGPDGA